MRGDDALSHTRRLTSAISLSVNKVPSRSGPLLNPKLELM